MGKNTKAAVVQPDHKVKKAEGGVKPPKESKKGKSQPAKPAKEPTPQSSEDEDDSVDETMVDADDTSDSSESSESEAEAKPAAKTNGASRKAAPVVNGGAKATINGDAEDDSDEGSADDSDEESDEDDDSEPEKAVGASTKPASAANISASEKKAAESQEEDSGSESESDEDVKPKAAQPKKSEGGDSEESSEEDDEVDDGSDSEDDEEEKSKPDGPVDADALHGALTKISSKEESAKSESSAAEESGSGSEESSEEEEEEEEKPAPKNKRKADEDRAPAPKKSRVESSSKTGNPPNNNLFVGNLSWNVDDEWLVRTFEKYGEVKHAFVKFDRETNKHKGFGFVEFVDLDAAIVAHDAMNEPDATIDGRKPNCDYGSSGRRQSGGNPKERAQAYGDQLSEPSNVVFVGNTSFNSTQDSIGQAFEQFGEIQSVRLPTDRDTGEMKGFAFVEYGSVEEATAAIEGMKGQYVDGRPIRLDFTTPRAGGDRRGGFGGGDRRGGFGGGDRGGRGNFRGGRGDRGGPRGGNRGGFRGGPPKTEFKGSKITF